MKTFHAASIKPGFRRVLWAGAGAFLFCAAALDAAPSADPADSKSYLIEESFHVAASTKVVWQVLTDYDNMQRYVSSMRSSRAVRRDGMLIVEQESTGSFFFIRKKVRLELRVDENPMQAILFEDLSRKDFESYVGSWRLKPLADGIEVSYFLRARPNFPTPRWFASGIFRGAVRKLLEEVRSEMLSREKREMPGGSATKSPL